MVLSKKHLKVVCTPVSSTKTTKEATSMKMKVCIRIRPLNTREETAACRSIVRLVNDQVLIFDPKDNDQPFFFHGMKQCMRDISKKQNKEMEFLFDRVYGRDCTNEDVFMNSISAIFGPLFDGYNCSVFVYGATGAGKTYTMLGNTVTPGIIYLTMRSLFEKIEAVDDKHFDIGISYLEVYNENVHDLLNPSSGPLHLREDSVNGVMVAGMKVVQIEDAEHLFELLRQGNANRTQHPTDANAESSRSHAVFQVFIKMQANCGRIQLVKLSMIDLAGSERGAATNCKGVRFKEGANINKSLLALGNCINNLADGVRHIPYRDSKLTRLLKDSLGGNCQTVMIACIGPTTLSYEDTYNTLKYAARARTIKMKMMKTVFNANTHMHQYRALVQEKDTKITEMNKRLEEMRQEMQKLREMAKLPNVDDLNIWTEKLINLYSAKKKIHQKILRLESKEKIIRWRIKYKHGSVGRVCAIDNSDDEDINRLEMQVNRMEGQLSGVYTKINELWQSKIEVDKQIFALEQDAVAENVSEPLAAEVARQQAAILAMEANVQNEHLLKLLNLLDQTTVTQEDLITKMAEQYKEQHDVLREFNKITNSMADERKDLISLLKGKRTISWEISPTSDVKKRSDILKGYAHLSIDLLHTDHKSCPLMLQDIKEDPSNGENASSQEVIPEINTTFTLPEVKRPLVPAIKIKTPKRDSMKENKLPRAAPRRALPLITLSKSKTVHGTQRLFKAPKRPLATNNRNQN